MDLLSNWNSGDRTMSDYSVDDHRVNGVDVVGSWLIAAIVLATLFVLILPFGA